MAALVVAGIVFGVVSFALGRESGLSEPEPDGVAEPLPDHPLSADDLDRARFDVVLRGYRMDQVDALVNRVSSDLSQLQEYVDSLEGQLAAARGRPTAPPSAAEPADEPVDRADARDDRADATADRSDMQVDRADVQVDRSDATADHG